MRKYDYIDQYLQELEGDIYPQPDDAGHARMAQDVITMWKPWIQCSPDVLDVGCGTGFCEPMFRSLGTTYLGIAIGEDVITARNLGRNVLDMDYSFIEYPNEWFDFIFSRHSLEHSPMPLLTLMEWHRVGSHYLGLVLPKPDHWKFGGRNHYSVLSLNQIRVLLARSGWLPIRIDTEIDNEYRILCEKTVRTSYTDMDMAKFEVEKLDIEEVEWHAL